MSEIETRIDWESAAKDKVYVFLWDCYKRPVDPTVRRLVCYEKQSLSPFKTNYYCYNNADFVYDSDREKYTIKEEEPKYRRCWTWDEFKPFAGKWAKSKYKEKYIQLSSICFDERVSDYLNPGILLQSFELLEPINGSTVIGVKE